LQFSLAPINTNYLKKHDYMTQLLYKKEEKRSSRGASRTELEEEESS
jgi:hypothetical protein